MAIPNAIMTFVIATLLQKQGADDFEAGSITVFHENTATAASMAMAAFTSVMTFILYNRSSIAYDRWWEGGTLLQKTRGEWFNAYSSIMAFTSTRPELQAQVEEYQHLLARLMSLLMCCGLQQVSPNRDRPFEIYHLGGIDPDSIDFLNSAPDKVEIILQWIQRSMVLHAQSGVLPVAPPILSRAFQEFSRGIVNLQNARKIADFPYPYPLAQISMILQMLHWFVMPLGAALAVPRAWAVLLSFFSIFVLWCIHFNAIELEFPFGDRTNDLPMVQLQQDWNDSVWTLLDRRATRPPGFEYQPDLHCDPAMAMSDGTEFGNPRSTVNRSRGSMSRESIKMTKFSKTNKGRRLSKVSQGSSEISCELSSDETARGINTSDGVASGTSTNLPEAAQDVPQLPTTSTKMPVGEAEWRPQHPEDAEVLSNGRAPLDSAATSLQPRRAPPKGAASSQQTGRVPLDNSAAISLQTEAAANSLQTGVAERRAEEVDGSGIAIDVCEKESTDGTGIKVVARSSNDDPASSDR
eukprot:TRINITY_DN14165_c0_g6_i1.p1 TRINITY_DN14165_c0_g6~~TRINITY_DN14165_c0_g6_i1.p1  ORF type:complete len:572 (-),score=82.88 TRINITY_DN14165_c0_g6_i1:29-1597(-)